ncbi:addiction module HigA family antidote [Paraburkholderia silvatlantica]|uniref:Addiction module HigA family antidote n=1 Tax=Paraburkholderia silvatlantica TaxID=321895 RepID=A0A2V4U2N4_9BURK|nr:HigA family addiction module antitoxin [Paraburkholderia silvatlantica]PYE27968.1 addiction module HigA family antidote [Paraburkholderia silvatlantica]
MNKNDAIFSGFGACPAREIAEQLHFAEWDLSEDDAWRRVIPLLVGAVTTLAREVDRLTPRMVEQDVSSTPDTYGDTREAAGRRELARLNSLVLAGAAPRRSLLTLDTSGTRSPVHPGAVLRNSLPKGMTVTQAAEALQINRVTLSNLLNANASITANIALRLSAWLGTTPDMWMAIQTQWDLWQAEQQPRPDIKPFDGHVT